MPVSGMEEGSSSQWGSNSPGAGSSSYDSRPVSE